MFRIVKKLLVGLLILLTATVIGFVAIDARVREQADPYIYDSIEAIPKGQTALVLGAQVFPDQTPSRALAYRLSTATALYQAGKVTTLLMSGDGRSKYYDEVGAMYEYAKEAGIPESAIKSDDAGLRTYDSCYRAKNEYDLTKLTVVTQSEHLVRAVYTCRRLGIDAIGVRAPEFTTFKIDDTDYWTSWLREKGALLKAWYEVEVSPRG